MARKIKLNSEDKLKIAFIFANEGCNPKKDRSIIESEKIIMYVVGCADYNQAETVAQEMLEEGCVAIDLCGAFGNEGVARICKAVDRKIPVGAVHFDFHPAFRDKSGDDLFQRIFGVLGFDVTDGRNQRTPYSYICDFSRGVLNARLKRSHPTLAPRPQI